MVNNVEHVSFDVVIIYASSSACSGHHDHDHHHHGHGHTEEKVPAYKSSSKDSVALLEQPEENAHNHSHGCQKKPRKSVVGLKPQEDKPVLEVMVRDV